MANGITNKLWSLEDIVAKIDAMAPAPKPHGLTRGVQMASAQMITTIVLANLAVVLAYLAGASTDISALLARSEARAKLFSALTAIAMAILVLVVFRYPN